MAPPLELPSRAEIRFWFRQRLLTIQGLSPQTTVLQWLREVEGAKGTKEGCGEGDCGACTVVVGTLDAMAPQGLRLRAMNSCLMLLPALDGKALFTIEDVATGDLHPVQRALVDLHASQCGFCTPGFVMSLWADYEERTAPPSRSQTLTTLSGNLCRCTGYRPIVEAAEAAWSHPVVKIDRRPVASALATVAALPPLHYEGQSQTWTAPTSLERLTATLETNPEARLVAGTTDVGLWVTKGLKHLGPLVTTNSVAELHTLVEGPELGIGAAVSLTDAWRALVNRLPELAEFADRFASTPVRNAGTLGGNVANGSPIGDSMPVLLALGATLTLQKGATSRRLPLDQFYLGYQKTARQPGEVLVSIHIPPMAPGTMIRAWKVSKRRDQDISAVCAAFALTLANDGTVQSARIAFGGMAAVPARAWKTEQALIGKRLDEAVLAEAQAALATEFQPLTDGRATAEYRLQVAQNLLTRLQASL